MGKESSEAMNVERIEQSASEDENDEEKQYQVTTTDAAVPLKLRQSYSCSASSSNSNGIMGPKQSFLNLSVDTVEEQCDKRESKICHQYKVKNESSNKYGALIERNRNKLLKKGKSFKYESDSDGMDDFYNEFNTKEIKFLSKKHNFQKRRSQSFSLNRFSIDESVIEYHVPSVLNKIKRRNKNIKINIHINNDIVAKGKRSTKIKKSKELHQKSKSSFAVAAPANTFKHSQHASIDV